MALAKSLSQAVARARANTNSTTRSNARMVDSLEARGITLREVEDLEYRIEMEARRREQRDFFDA